MNMIECEWDDRIQQAARTGIWDDDLRSHADRCPACIDIGLVARAVRADALAARTGVQLPDPGRAWWRARLLARQDAAVRATRPIARWERFATITGLVAVAVAVWAFWPAMTESALEMRQAWTLVQPTSLGAFVYYGALAGITLLGSMVVVLFVTLADARAERSWPGSSDTVR